MAINSKASKNILDAIHSINRIQLSELWRKTVKCPVPPNTSQDVMRLIIGWKIQAKGAKADIRALKSTLNKSLNLDACSDSAKVPMRRVKTSLSPGTRLSRDWQGRNYVVDVLDKGFAFDGELFTSLTPIVKTITGSHRSGPHFFGVSK